ncbi:MAG: ring-cleaving dioxygenase [Acidobacteriota bacterium]|nr:ring-cleaving dioxygenase [Acidobacteriota bacterium]
MDSPILGLHHVTATVADAQTDLNFCLDALGLRLVKKTVNFDNHHVYHFYYGDEQGSPGSIWTTFPYWGHGVPVGTKGAGQVTTTSFSVPAGSLEFWRARFRSLRLTQQDVASRFGEESLTVVDPSGLNIELVANDRDARAPWIGGGIGADAAIRGLYSVTLTLTSPPETISFMRDVLGFEVVNEAERWTRVAVNGDEPGKRMEILHAPDAPRARNGLGTVHHVAMAVATADEQLRLRAELMQAGVTVTEVRDRQYFQSIYFREPGGVLFEVATMQPGFAVDEAPDELGQALKLPPWEEPNRQMIEAGLDTVTYRS